MKVYQALYCPCVWESSFGTLSTHFSEEGAIKAIKAHKARERKKFNLIYKDEKVWKPKFGEHEDWMISEIEVLP